MMSTGSFPRASIASDSCGVYGEWINVFGISHWSWRLRTVWKGHRSVQSETMYIPFFLIKTVLFSLILQYGMLYSFSSYVTNAAAGLVFFYFLSILLLRPYKNSIISNLSVIVNEAIVIHSFLLVDLKRFITIDEST